MDNIRVMCLFTVEGMADALALEIQGLGLKAKTVAPGAYMQTSFSQNRDDGDLESGDADLVAHAKEVMDHFHGNVGRSADHQEVADMIYKCATEDTPIRNPVGRDSEMLIGMMNSAESRSAFLDQVVGFLIPESHQAE